MRTRIAVVDYGAANMVSITRALAAVGADVSVAVDSAGFENVDAIVVPGVGAARAAMVQLDAQGLRGPILDWAIAGRPMLGICLGFQLLFEASDEGDAEALGVLSGRTRELVDAPRCRISAGTRSRSHARARSSTASRMARTSISFTRTRRSQPTGHSSSEGRHMAARS